MIKPAPAFCTFFILNLYFLLFCYLPKVKEESKVPEPTADEVAITEAERLYATLDYVSVYEFLIKFKDSNNDELLWRLSRACRDVAQHSATPAEQKKPLTYDSLTYARKAQEINDNNWAAHKVCDTM